MNTGGPLIVYEMGQIKFQNHTTDSPHFFAFFVSHENLHKVKFLLIQVSLCAILLYLAS